MTYSVKTDFGTYDVLAFRCTYADKRNILALLLNDAKDGSPFATISVNLEDEYMIGDTCYTFLDTNNCPWAEDFIISNNLGEPTDIYGYSGFCKYPLYKIDIDKFKKLT